MLSTTEIIMNLDNLCKENNTSLEKHFFAKSCVRRHQKWDPRSYEWRLFALKLTQATIVLRRLLFSFKEHQNLFLPFQGGYRILPIIPLNPLSFCSIFAIFALAWKITFAFGQNNFWVALFTTKKKSFIESFPFWLPPVLWTYYHNSFFNWKRGRILINLNARNIFFLSGLNSMYFLVYNRKVRSLFLCSTERFYYC